MVLEVTAVEVLDDFRLRVAFNDGVSGVVDVEPLLWGELFEPLRDPERFREAFLDEGMGTVAWPNEADLAPTALRERCRPEPAPAGARRSTR